ncbi:hypothetical protein TgHK011_008395 [Trichoderma gracile]|nr:hypothetical protein TgHK011_008395 [Trichoderma gracile]
MALSLSLPLPLAAAASASAAASLVELARHCSAQLCSALLRASPSLIEPHRSGRASSHATRPRLELFSCLCDPTPSIRREALLLCRRGAVLCCVPALPVPQTKEALLNPASQTSPPPPQPSISADSLPCQQLNAPHLCSKCGKHRCSATSAAGFDERVPHLPQDSNPPRRGLR